MRKQCDREMATAKKSYAEELHKHVTRLVREKEELAVSLRALSSKVRKK